MFNIIKKLFIISLLICTNLFSSDFDERKSKGKIEYDNLDEISGLVFGTSNPDIIWAVNDGRADEVYGMDRNGNSVTVLDFKKELLEQDTDIEDIATIRLNNLNYIVLADIGDNNENRETVNLYFVPELKFNGNPEMNVDESLISKVQFKYEDGSRDAECMFIDPTTNNIYLVTKRETKARMYELKSDLSFTKINTADFILEFEFGNNVTENSTGVTAGDISKDGKHILIRDYTSVWYFSNDNNNLISNLQNSGKKVESYTYSFNKEPQGESIAWDSDNSGFYTASEEKSFENFDSDLFYFKRIQTEIKKKNDLVYQNEILNNRTNKTISYSLYNLLGQKVFHSQIRPKESIEFNTLEIKARYLLYDNKFLIINSF